MQADDTTRAGSLLLCGGSAAPAPAPVAPEPQLKVGARARPKAPARPADGEDNTNRKLLNLPPVVGSYLQYPNKNLLYRPFPSDVDEVRKKLFLVEKPILLDSQQIADYWPHVSNCYMRSGKVTANDNGTVTEAWECRIRRRVTMKGKDGRMTGQGLRQRQNKDELLGEVEPCKFRLNLMSFTKHVESEEACGGPGFGNCTCVSEWLHIQRTDHAVEDDLQHTHALDLLDEYKRSNALLYYCKLKVEEGHYSYAAVATWIKEKYGPISTQLQHLTKADVANVARFWRAQNKDVELRSEIVEDTDKDRQRKDCFDSIQTTSAERLRKALMEVCKVYPHAVELVAPFMEKRTDDQNHSKLIAEGDEINIPPPGRPRKRKTSCDPPDHATPITAPWKAPLPSGPLQPVGQGPQFAPAYSHRYPMPAQVMARNQNAAQGLRISLPAPSMSTAPQLPPSQPITHGLSMPAPPYPAMPRPSWAQPAHMPAPDIDEQLRNELS